MVNTEIETINSRKRSCPMPGFSRYFIISYHDIACRSCFVGDTVGTGNSRHRTINTSRFWNILEVLEAVHPVVCKCRKYATIWNISPPAGIFM